MASLIRPSPVLRVGGLTTPRPSPRSFHTSSPSRASILFALHALSNSRETQHFNKISNLHRMEHSPPLKLIKTGEIDPFPLPTPPKIPVAPILPARASLKLSTPIWDRRALDAGRAVLAENARSLKSLAKSMERSQTRAARQQEARRREQESWQKERERMRNELRAAGAWILASVGVATALATWRFWPSPNAAADSGLMGRKIAERATAAIPLPAVASSTLAGVGTRAESILASAPAVVPVTASGPALSTGSGSAAVSPASSDRSWWKGLFWVQP